MGNDSKLASSGKGGTAMERHESESMTRRSFVKGSAGAAAAVGVAGVLGGCAKQQEPEEKPEPEQAEKPAPKPEDNKTVQAVAKEEGVWLPSQCNMCFNACSILGHVVDGKLVEI